MATTARQIGISIDINARTNLDDFNRIDPLIRAVNDDGLYMNAGGGQNMDVNTFLEVPPRVAITISGEEFYTLGRLGAPGGFGQTIAIRKLNDPTVYALKRQLDEADHDTALAIIKEAIIGRALYNFTNNRAIPQLDTGPACLNVYTVVKSQRTRAMTIRGTLLNCKYYYILMEKGEDTFKNALERHGGANIANFLSYTRRLAIWLNYLYRNYNYVHGDLKSNNILVDGNGHLRFIDYGFNRITVNGLPITAQNWIVHTDFRDFTLYAHELYYISPMVRNNNVARDFIEWCLTTGTNATLLPGTNFYDGITIPRLWDEAYTFLQNANSRNPNGNAIQILRYTVASAPDNTPAANAPPNPFVPPPPPPPAPVARGRVGLGALGGPGIAGLGALGGPGRAGLGAMGGPGRAGVGAPAAARLPLLVIGVRPRVPEIDAQEERYRVAATELLQRAALDRANFASGFEIDIHIYQNARAQWLTSEQTWEHYIMPLHSRLRRDSDALIQAYRNSLGPYYSSIYTQPHDIRAIDQAQQNFFNAIDALRTARRADDAAQAAAAAAAAVPAPVSLVPAAAAVGMRQRRRAGSPGLPAAPLPPQIMGFGPHPRLARAAAPASLPAPAAVPAAPQVPVLPPAPRGRLNPVFCRNVATAVGFIGTGAVVGFLGLPIIGIGGAVGCLAGMGIGIQTRNVLLERRLIGGKTRKQKRKSAKKTKKKNHIL
jgi:hypothetical protein